MNGFGFDTNISCAPAYRQQPVNKIYAEFLQCVKTYAKERSGTQKTKLPSISPEKH